MTRDEVARRAGISTAVVSYVLNDGPRPVAPRTRARVLSVIEELGYRPNAIARALRSRRSEALGLIVSDISNPFIGELVLSIERKAFERGYTVLLGNTVVDGERQRRYLRHFIDRQVDGLLLVPVASIDAATIDELNSGVIPVVVLDRPVPRSRATAPLRAATLMADNVGGARQVARHLIEHGHRHIGCVSGPPMMPPTNERLEGWSQAIEEARLPLSRCPVVRASVNRRAGYDAAIELLVGRRRPTAVFATSDEQAIGVLRAAAELGLRVPADLAVAGFDGIAQGAFCTPGLTTVRQPVEDMASRAVATLLAQIVAGSIRSRTQRLPVELVCRGSCGCPDVPVAGRPQGRLMSETTA